MFAETHAVLLVSTIAAAFDAPLRAGRNEGCLQFGITKVPTGATLAVELRSRHNETLLRAVTHFNVISKLHPREVDCMRRECAPECADGSDSCLSQAPPPAADADESTSMGLAGFARLASLHRPSPTVASATASSNGRRAAPWIGRRADIFLLCFDCFRIGRLAGRPDYNGFVYVSGGEFVMVKTRAIYRQH